MAKGPIDSRLIYPLDGLVELTGISLKAIQELGFNLPIYEIDGQQFVCGADFHEALKKDGKRIVANGANADIERGIVMPPEDE